MNNSHSCASELKFARLFFKFAAVTKMQINMTRKLKEVIVSFCQRLFEPVFKAFKSCYFGKNIGLLAKKIDQLTVDSLYLVFENTAIKSNS